jgi:putative NADPH-quinone reductase
MKRITIIDGNPKRGGLSRELAEAYRDGAEEAGHEVRLFSLAEMAFDPILHEGLDAEQAPEPDLLEARAAIAWGQHVVWIWPLRFGFPPALLLGFVERAFQLDFAATPAHGGKGYAPLLIGRTARIVATMATPALAYRLIGGARSVRTFRINLLQFVGIRPVRTTFFSTARRANETKRLKWREEMRSLGRRAA